MFKIKQWILEIRKIILHDGNVLNETSQLETRNKQDYRKWREAFRVWSVYFTANLSSLNKMLRGRMERRHSSRWIPAWCLYSSASRSFSTLSRWNDSLAKRTNYLQHWTCSIEYSLINVIISYVDCLSTFLITRDSLSFFFLLSFLFYLLKLFGVLI